ncbi:MAG: hypothetical protein IT473_00395 [Lysobacter sp.]|nr:hypothetical protein [Lysobacter sp.]
MNATRNARGRRPLSLALGPIVAGIVVGSASFAANASWEVYSGLNPHREQLHGVADVQFCTGGGQVATGTQTAPTAAAGFNNMVVERKDTANPVAGPWRFSYDSGRSEEGRGIVEYTDGTGFAVVGTWDTLTTPIQTHLTISKIDCNGNMVWHRSYGTTAGKHTAWDIIRATTGDAAFNTAPGDLIALAEYSTGTTNFVRVARVRNNGALIWMRDYVVPTGTAVLTGRGIAEVETPSLADNLVVAGSYGNNTAIFQIDGNNGNFICGSQLRGQGLSRFNDITRHGASGTTIAPGFTAVGETRVSSTALPQAFVASYRSTGCGLQRQVHWGSPNESETAQAVTTTRATTFGTVPSGQLLIAGNITGAFLGTNSRDVWTHLMVPIQLTAYTVGGYTGQRYGTQGAGLAGSETVADVAESSNGAHFVGATTSNWDGLNDPLDGYSVRMGFSGMKTLCSVPWSGVITAMTPFTALTVAPTWITPSAPLNPLPRATIPAALCCGIGP